MRFGRNKLGKCCFDKKENKEKYITFLREK